MKPVNPRLIVLAISLALIAVLAGCSGGESRNSTATVYVQGAGSSASRYVAASAGGSSAPGFESGEVIVSGENVTDRLSSSDVETGQAAGGANDKLFEATVENVPSVVTLEVEPKRGFVFNEWRLNTHRVFTIGNLSWSEYIDLMLSPAERHSETLVVPADKAEYYIATFERGYYIDLESTSSEGIGTKSSPYGSFDEAINAMKSARFIDEEITFKVAGSDPSEVLTLSEMASIHTNGDELEELTEIDPFLRGGISDGDMVAFEVINPGDDVHRQIEFGDAVLGYADGPLSRLGVVFEVADVGLGGFAQNRLEG